MRERVTGHTPIKKAMGKRPWPENKMWSQEVSVR